KAVEQCRGHPLTLEDLAPLTEGQVARHEDAAPLVTVGEDAEQQLDAPAAHRHVAQLVADQQVRPVELVEEPVEGVLLLLLLQLADQPRRREEPHPQARPTRRQPESNRNMSLSRSMTPHEATIAFL